MTTDNDDLEEIMHSGREEGKGARRLGAVDPASNNVVTRRVDGGGDEEEQVVIIPNAVDTSNDSTFDSQKFETAWNATDADAAGAAPPSPKAQPPDILVFKNEKGTTDVMSKTERTGDDHKPNELDASNDGPPSPATPTRGSTTTTTATTALGAMFGLGHFSRGRRPAASAPSPGFKRAISSDLEATQASDGEPCEVGDDALDFADLGEARSARTDEENRSLPEGDESNEESGVEMSLRQFQFSRIPSLNRWTSSFRDLKQRRRRCFWATVAALALVLLLIVVVGGSCGAGRCSTDTRASPAAAVSPEEGDPDPYFGRLTDAPISAPTYGATSGPSTVATAIPSSVSGDDTYQDNDAVVSGHDPMHALLGGSNLNIVVFDPSMSPADIKSTADTIFYRQQNNEMGTERCILYFMPGTYGSYEQPLYLQIGYYTEVAGLGAFPEDVMIYGKIEVYNRCFEPDPYKQGMFVPGDGSGLCFALNSFWRSMSNLAIQIVSLNQDQCRSTAMFWAVSQASSMRRVDIRGGDVSLMDYCTRTLCCLFSFLDL
jgi:hypothetical protein